MYLLSNFFIVKSTTGQLTGYSKHPTLATLPILVNTVQYSEILKNISLENKQFFLLKLLIIYKI